MDEFGVPKKINRHVIKAIYELSDQESKSSDLSNICDMVEISMQNNVPVANLLSVVRRSLQNLSKLGVINKKGTKYFKPSLNKAPLSRYHLKRPISKTIEKAVWDEEVATRNPINKKKRLLSEDSITEYKPESSKNRLRRSKPLSRKGKQVSLPKARKHTGFQLSHIGEMEQESGPSSSNGFQLSNIGEMEQESSPSSNNGSEINAEDENENKTVLSSVNPRLFCSEIFKSDMMEKIGLNNRNKSFENLLHLPDVQINKFDDVLIHERINKFDVLNENENENEQQQLDESKNIDLEKDSIAFDSKEDNINVMTSHTNMFS